MQESTKAVLLAELADLKRWAEHRGNQEFVKGLSLLIQKLHQERFNLAVLGEFKRGKSTLINALLGQPFLPMAVVPLTSVITAVEYADALKVEVQFQNGLKETISVDAIPAYVTERENPKNQKGVAEVLLAYPSPFLKAGVRLIDTPGVGSVYDHNTKVALGFLPKVDAALFVLSADPPIGEAESSFLRQLRPYVEKLFFLLNKIDLLTEDDQREALEFTQATLCTILDVSSVRLYPVSARLALEGKTQADLPKLTQSQFSSFEKDLEAFLLEEKGRVLLSSTINRVTRMLEQERFALSLQEGILNAPLGALPERQAAFERQKVVILKKRTEADHFLQREINQLIEILDQDLMEFKQIHSSGLLPQLRETYSGSQENGNALRKRLYDHIQENIQIAFDGWLAAEEKKLARELSRVTGLFADQINSVVQRLMELSAGLFGVHFEPLVPIEALSIESSFYYYDVRMEFSFIKPILDRVVDLLPARLSRSFVLREAQQVLNDQIERHCGRVRADFLQRLAREVNQFRMTLDQWADQTVQQIEQAMAMALELKTQSAAQLTAQLKDLKQEIQKLNCILERLQQLHHDVS